MAQRRWRAGWALCTSPDVDGGRARLFPAGISTANSWRTITKMSRDYLPLAQWCNVDDPHMLARNITMVHSGLKPYNAKKAYIWRLSAMHTFKLCMGCRQPCTQISCLDIWDIGVCNLQNAIINIFEAKYRVYDNILMHWYNIGCSTNFGGLQWCAKLSVWTLCFAPQ